MAEAKKLDIDDIDVRLSIKASFVITLGLYSGPITKKIVADNLRNYISAMGDFLEDAIDSYTVDGVLIDDEEQII